MHFTLFLQWIKRKLGIDRAVAFGSFSTVWGALGGSVSMLLIALRFSPEVQGYYYTFNSLLALTTFVELGLGTVIQQFASHEWARLDLDSSQDVVGDANALSRLASLARVSFRWYGFASALAVIGLGVGGIEFFSQRPSPEIHWAAPWLAICGLSGVRLVLVPAWSLLDGCDQMRHTNAARLGIAVVTNVSCWAAIVVGAGLWTLVILNGANLAAAATFFVRRYRGFFRAMKSAPRTAAIDWRAEVWPMQWRIALSWLSGFFIFSLFTPVMFQFQGAVVAGQMGMTLSLANALLAIALTWVTTKAPAFGQLISLRDFAGLDRLFAASTAQGLTVGGIGALAILGGTYGLNAIHSPLAMRFLPPFSVGLFVVSALIATLVGAMATYLRAHKREPYLVPSVLCGISVAAATFVLGSRYGAFGAGIGYLVLSFVFLVPEVAIFRHCQATWHITEPGVSR